MATLGTVALLIAVSLGIVGYERVSQRLGTLTSASLEEMDRGTGRRTIWSTVIKAIPDYALLGSGLGSHRDIYPMYLEQAGSRKYFSHAESGYLQVALESGLLGLGLVLAGVVVCGFWCVTGLRNSSSNRLMVCMGAVSASLAASAAHSLVDFVWYVPGCMAMVAVLAGCACRLCQLATDRDCPRRGSIVVPRPLGMAAVLVLLTVGLWMLQNRLGPAIAQSHWEHYLMLSRDEPDLLLFDEQPADGSGTDAEHQSTLAAKQKIVAELEEVVRRDPDHARAHVRLAKAYVRLFHQRQKTSANVMPVSQIRDAVFGSQAETVPPERRLDSRRRLERWLSQAIGDHYRHLDVALRHTRQGLALCPLLGEGYLLLGELCFLDGGSAGNKTACIAQALKVRPFDGDVLFHAGNEAVLAGDRPQGLAYWQQSFRAGKVYQEQIINRLVGRVFPMDLKEEIKIFLRAFQPGLDGLRAMDRRYQEIAPPEQMVPLYQVYAETAKREAHAKKGQEAAALLLEAMALYGKLDLPAECLQCGRSALECNPYDFYVRKKVAYCFAGVGQFAEAREHLEWCLKRKPGNKRLQEDIREILRQEIQQTRQTTLTDQVAEDPRTHHPLQEDRGDLRQSARPPIVPSSAIEPTGNF